MSRNLALLLLVLLLAGGAAWWLLPRKKAGVTPPQGTRPTAAADQLALTDVTLAAGITFKHNGLSRGEKLTPETRSGGCTFLDLEGDGDQDLLLINSVAWPGDSESPSEQPAVALYQNDGLGNFQDVTEAWGLAATAFYGMDATVGDIDGDGDPDVFISAVGRNYLLINKGERFAEEAGRAGVAGEAGVWSSDAVLLDTDADGDLDLFVANFVEWSVEADLARELRPGNTSKTYGLPDEFPAAHSLLYRNEGGGLFRNVSAESGVRVSSSAGKLPLARATGAAAMDLDRDGLPEILVSSSGGENLLLRNLGGNRFEHVGHLVGMALDPLGNPTESGGIDAVRTPDGEILICLAGGAGEPTLLLRSMGRKIQLESPPDRRYLEPTRTPHANACKIADLDLDGALDLVLACGHPEMAIARFRAGQTFAQRPIVLLGSANGEPPFAPVASTGVADDPLAPLVGSDLALADIDGDGDLDILITQAGGAPRLLRNDGRQ